MQQQEYRPEPLRREILREWGALDQAFDGWREHLKECGLYALPRAGVWELAVESRGRKKHQRIIDSMATRAVRILAAGWMSGNTSPSAPWVRYRTPDPELNEWPSAAAWLELARDRTLEAFAAGNTYRVLHQGYTMQGVFGTACALRDFDRETLVRLDPVAMGRYRLAQDASGVVNTMFRQFAMTVAQVVDEFGWDACSRQVQDSWNRADYHRMVQVVHAVRPRRRRDPRRADNRNMPWQSVYLEQSGDDDGQVLRESGYRRFPVLAPRWGVDGPDVYGWSPMMEALGDVKQLQHLQERKSQALDYKIRPALQAPLSMAGREIQTLPGGITFTDQIGPQSGIQTAWQVQIDEQAILEDIRDVRERIRAAFFLDVFLMLANDPTGQRTATEILARESEKMMVLGPTLHQHHAEVQDPLVSGTFQTLLETGALPPPPPELEGQLLSIEYTGPLAQAQRQIGLVAIDRVTSHLGVLVALQGDQADVGDNFDADKSLRIYADRVGVDPRLLRDPDEVQVIRENRAASREQERRAGLLQVAASSAKDLAASGVR